MLEAIQKVVRDLPEATLVIVGDGVERGPIEAAVEALDLGAHVRLLGMRHDVPRILPAFDVKVLSSKMEANPASILEASACGLPVVASAVGSLPETVLEGAKRRLAVTELSQFSSRSIGEI